MKKSILMLLSLIALCALLGGCAAGNANSLGTTSAPAATTAPTAAATPMPTMAPLTTSPAQSEQPMNGMQDSMPAEGANTSRMSAADAGKMAQRIAEALERISEVKDAEVIVEAQRALVAVEFDDQYSAGLDERMKKLITDTVKKEDDAITDVQITDDSTLYGQVKSLAQRIGNATGLDELADDIGSLFDRITGK